VVKYIHRVKRRRRRRRRRRRSVTAAYTAVGRGMAVKLQSCLSKSTNIITTLHHPTITTT